MLLQLKVARTWCNKNIGQMSCEPTIWCNQCYSNSLVSLPEAWTVNYSMMSLLHNQFHQIPQGGSADQTLGLAMAQLRLQPLDPLSFKVPDDWTCWKQRFDQFQISQAFAHYSWYSTPWVGIWAYKQQHLPELKQIKYSVLLLVYSTSQE